MAVFGLARPYVALFGLWPRMVLILFTAMNKYGLIGTSMALCVIVLACMGLYGLVRPCMALKAILWSFIAENHLDSRS